MVDFEILIEHELRGWKIERARLVNHHLQREQRMREKYNFRIEALELALNETKLKTQREINRSEMLLQDIESAEMNFQAAGYFDEIEKFVLTEADSSKKYTNPTNPTSSSIAESNFEGEVVVKRLRSPSKKSNSPSNRKRMADRRP